MQRHRYVPQIEKLGKIQLLSLNVSASVNPAIPSGSATSADNSPISGSAHGNVDDANASATANSLSVEASGGDGLSEGAGSTASGFWSFQVQGVPTGVQVPLTFSYKMVGSATAMSSPTESLNLSLGSYSYTIYSDVETQTGAEQYESENGSTVYQYAKNVQAPGTISGTYSTNGYISVLLQASATSTTGSGATASSNAIFQLIGVSSTAASQYPNIAVEFDDGRVLNANPFLVPQGQFTFDNEGNDNPDSDGFSRDLSHPTDASGVTIGRGYDMKDRSPTQIYNDMINAGIDQYKASILAQASGKTGVAADNFIDQFYDYIGTITPDQQYNLFNNTYPAYVQQAEDNYYEYTVNSDGEPLPGRVDWDQLDESIRDILTDLVYNGYAGVTAMPAADENDISDFIYYLENNTELNQPGGVQNRNNERIQYLENNS